MSSLPQPDFLHPVRGTHPLSRLACGAVLLALAVAAIDAADAWNAREAALAPAPRPLTATRPAAKPDPEGQRASKQALAALDRPWATTFAALEAGVVTGVAWLALDIGERGALRLEGQAPDAASALAAAEALRQAGGWREVLVARMEKAPDGQQRFSLVAEQARGSW